MPSKGIFTKEWKDCIIPENKSKGAHSASGKRQADNGPKLGLPKLLEANAVRQDIKGWLPDIALRTKGILLVRTMNGFPVSECIQVRLSPFLQIIPHFADNKKLK